MSEPVSAAQLGPCWSCQALTSGLRNAEPQDGPPASAAPCSCLTPEMTQLLCLAVMGNGPLSLQVKTRSLRTE